MNDRYIILAVARVLAVTFRFQPLSTSQGFLLVTINKKQGYQTFFLEISTISSNIMEFLLVIARRGSDLQVMLCCAKFDQVVSSAGSQKSLGINDISIACLKCFFNRVWPI